MTGALLELEELQTGYHAVAVVHGLSLHVQPGEIVALLGPNGAGKSTTLLTISGLLPVLSGQIRYDGRPLPARRPQDTARAGIGHVPEDRALFYSLTVEENLRIGPARDRHALQEALSYFPALAALLPRRTGLLSGGEQQMLAIARALCGKPRLLLVDEASLGLAPLAVAQLMPTLRRIADDSGCGILLVEQHVQLALEVADRAYIISHGAVTAQGRARDLLHQNELLESAYLGTIDVDPEAAATAPPMSQKESR
jgi:branched-chain amino acid transport system ATP-binding protein